MRKRPTVETDLSFSVDNGFPLHIFPFQEGFVIPDEGGPQEEQEEY